ncbi:MAG TPA: hypothetical protein VK524_20740 [Polyangiaceae bacterium]|nr:hypothetical protein [Polyangiaceae bacterium]
MRKLSALLALSFVAQGCRCSESDAPRRPSPSAPSISGALGTHSDAGSHAAGVQPPPLATRLCETLHVVPGRRVSECCGRGETRYLYAECVRVVSASLQSGAVVLDSAAVDRCAQSMQRALNGCDWVTPSQPLSPKACQGLVKGAVPAGASCRSSLECVAPLHCDGSSASQPGRCRQPQPLGAPCAAGVDALATYLLEREPNRDRPQCAGFCSLISRSCEVAPALGTACVATVNCAAGQRCVERRCAEAARPARSSAGSACVTDLDCEVGGCARGADGEKRCGMKCSASIADLAAGGPKFGLPARPKR